MEIVHDDNRARLEAFIANADATLATLETVSGTV
jgi:hypothetical protein